MVGGLTFEPTVTFNEDGSFVSKSVASAPNGKATITSTDTGTWKLEGDKLTTHFADVNWEFGGVDKDRLEKARDRFAGRKQQILDSLNQHPPDVIHWNGSDEFSSLEDGKTVTYHRKK